MMKRLTTALLAMALAGLLMGARSSGGDDDDAGPASIDDQEASSDDDGDDGAGGGGVGSPSQEEEDAALEYAQCMRDHGVDMPDPEISDGGIGISIDGDSLGVSEDELAAAEEECQPILEEAMPEREPLDPEELAERRDQAVAMAQCMRDRGYDMPDPVIDDQGGVAIENPGDMGGPGDPQFEEFEADMRDCNEESGMGNPDGGETTQSGGSEG